MDPCVGTSWLLFTKIVTMKLHLETSDLSLKVDGQKWKNFILCKFASFQNLKIRHICLFERRSTAEILAGFVLTF